MSARCGFFSSYLAMGGLILLLAAGCGGGGGARVDGAGCSVGGERCSCTAGGGCDPGLACLSGLCVRPPDGETRAGPEGDAPFVPPADAGIPVVETGRDSYTGQPSDTAVGEAAASPNDDAATLDGATTGPDAAAAGCEIHRGEIPATAYRPRAQGGTAPPRRLVIFYTPLGTILPAWRPSGSGTSFTLSPILEPLAPHKSQLVVLDGIDNVAAPGSPATTAASGASVLLTGHPGAAASFAGMSFVCGGATSLDVALGHPAVAFPTVHLGVGVAASSPLPGPLLPSFVERGRALLPEIDPRAAAARLQLVLTVPPGDPLAEANYPAMVQSQIEVAAQALARDKTRTVMLSFGTPTSRTRFPWLGIDRSYAEVAAASGGDAGAAVAFRKIQTWYAEQLARLAALLASVREGDGTLLDNTLVVWVSETGEASSGNGRNIPVVLLGRAGGALSTGRSLRMPAGTNQADLLFTVAGLIGVTGFGDPSLNPRGLPGL